jgi:uncharacterized small protein (DUF1192 family)
VADAGQRAAQLAAVVGVGEIDQRLAALDAGEPVQVDARRAR